jgi:hypothetical protein
LRLFGADYPLVDGNGSVVALANPPRRVPPHTVHAELAEEFQMRAELFVWL